MIKSLIIAAAALTMSGSFAQAQTMIQKNNIQLSSDLMTPEALWAMGRLSGAAASPNGKQVVYQVSYYSVKENKNNPKKMSGLAARMQAMQEYQQREQEKIRRQREELERKKSQLGK